LIPFTPLSLNFDSAPLPFEYLLIPGSIVILYIVAAEAAKAVFYRHVNSGKSLSSGGYVEFTESGGNAPL